ncbi:hypothetical protein I6E74_05860 [Salinibacterium sp. SWN139]|uniref:hypothetical protein n=1 Tax=Salinibacterium sp. SWN139 TaxID=2792055 RepID=UPI0018CD1D1D|nr:hypothetical protein [Salinibacterium sp. SWN139]MBH0053696.1 hypothetical protein [Salinibacterium sp. SWN139]
MSLSQAWPLWLGGFWVLFLVLVVVASARMPGPQGSAARIQKSLVGQRTAQGQRIGHVAGWALFISSLVFMLTLVLVPLGAGVVALATWSKNRISQCSDDRLCVVSAIPENVLPVWIAFAWIVVIAAALAVCWHPSRWWMPDAQPRRGLTVRVDTSPLWIGGHAVVAAFICAALSLGVHQRGNDVYAPEYLWATLAAATVAVVANYRHRKLVGTVPLHIKESFFLTASSPAAAFSPEWRAKQRELHPRKKDGTNDG